LVNAADIASVEEGADPHLWYDPATVQATAAAITDELTALSPDAADYFAGQATAWQEELAPYLAAVDSLRGTAAGRTYAATEPVFDRMAAAIGLTDVSPEGYRRASSNHSDPAPGDLVAFEAALANGMADVLIYNTQTSGSVPEQLRAAADGAGVPVVEVSESPADASGSFVAWQLAQLSELSDALAGTP
jgi:zinc/manganese transport system substrate-binding protein